MRKTKKIVGLLVLLFAFKLSYAGKAENRCGWYDNPTPGNAWLHDKDGEWEISIQGGYEAKGDWSPKFDFDNEKEFESANGPSYGYGCICMKVDTDAKLKKIIKVSSIKIKDLATCRRDKKLKEPANPYK